MSDVRPGKSKKIGLFLGVRPHAGGMFQYAQSILEALATLENQYSVLIAYSGDEWTPILERLSLRGAPIRWAKVGQFIADLLMFMRLPPLLTRCAGRIINPLVSELQSFGCDIWIFPAQDSLTYQMPTPVVGTIHDLMHRYESTFPEVSSKGRYGIREHRFKNIARSCDAIIVDSPTGKEHVVESYAVSIEKIYVLPYVAPSYLRASETRPDFDKHYSLPAKFLFYPAQFWQHKNHLRLLEAVHLISKSHPDIALVLSGNRCHEFNRIEQKIIDLGMQKQVYFLGYIPDSDLGGIYRRARALVMPTFFGPTNIPPLEAMTFGCPVLVSKIYGMPDQCGNAALYFDPTSIEDIAASIEKIWADDALAESVGKNGINRSFQNSQLEFNKKLSEIIDLVFCSLTGDE